jgi:hypothetical protein
MILLLLFVLALLVCVVHAVRPQQVPLWPSVLLILLAELLRLLPRA